MPIIKLVLKVMMPNQRFKVVIKEKSRRLTTFRIFSAEIIKMPHIIDILKRRNQMRSRKGSRK